MYNLSIEYGFFVNFANIEKRRQRGIYLNLPLGFYAIYSFLR